MSAVPKQTMTADEFIAWAVKQPKEAGRFELVEGVVVKMMAERLVHVEIKAAMFVALRDAIRKSKRPCFSITDGAKVRISKTRTYDPDGLVYCGKRHPGDIVEIPNPCIVVEVLSPESAERDHGEKVPAYFSLPSIEHSLIVDPERRVVIHHRRGEGEDVITRFRKSGQLKLDPPGLTIDIEALFDRE